MVEGAAREPRDLAVRFADAYLVCVTVNVLPAIVAVPLRFFFGPP
jgi:hypothetical protein